MGKQTLLVGDMEIKEILNIFQIPYDKNYMHKRGRMSIDSYCLFKMIGFKEVHAIDCSSYEGADIICDLNQDLPEEYKEKFDYVIDGGVTEHVFNIAKVMENMTKLLSENGIIIHILPAGGLIDHGFYSFSPTFFLDYYKTNHFSILDLDMEFIIKPDEDHEYGSRVIYSSDCRMFNCDDDDWKRQDINSYAHAISSIKEVEHSYIWCIACKTVSSEVLIPFQGVYQDLYDFNMKKLLKPLFKKMKTQLIIDVYIFPYGKKGKEVYGYLKKRDVNVKAVDNNLCVENREIISLKDLSYIMADAAESVVLIASDNPVLYEDLRIEVKELIPEGKIIDLYP